MDVRAKQGMFDARTCARDAGHVRCSHDVLQSYSIAPLYVFDRHPLDCHDASNEPHDAHPNDHPIDHLHEYLRLNSASQRLAAARALHLPPYLSNLNCIPLTPVSLDGKPVRHWYCSRESSSCIIGLKTNFALPAVHAEDFFFAAHLDATAFLRHHEWQVAAMHSRQGRAMDAVQWDAMDGRH